MVKISISKHWYYFIIFTKPSVWSCIMFIVAFELQNWVEFIINLINLNKLNGFYCTYIHDIYCIVTFNDCYFNDCYLISDWLIWYSLNVFKTWAFHGLHSKCVWCPESENILCSRFIMWCDLEFLLIFLVSCTYVSRAY